MSSSSVAPLSVRLQLSPSDASATHNFTVDASKPGLAGLKEAIRTAQKDVNQRLTKVIEQAKSSNGKSDKDIEDALEEEDDEDEDEQGSPANKKPKV